MPQPIEFRASFYEGEDWDSIRLQVPDEDGVLITQAVVASVDYHIFDSRGVEVYTDTAIDETLGSGGSASQSYGEAIVPASVPDTTGWSTDDTGWNVKLLFPNSVLVTGGDQAAFDPKGGQEYLLIAHLNRSSQGPVKLQGKVKVESSNA